MGLFFHFLFPIHVACSKFVKAEILFYHNACFNYFHFGFNIYLSGSRRIYNTRAMWSKAWNLKRNRSCDSSAYEIFSAAVSLDIMKKDQDQIGTWNVLLRTFSYTEAFVKVGNTEIYKPWIVFCEVLFCLHCTCTQLTF